jgi:hypothetical protein
VALPVPPPVAFAAVAVAVAGLRRVFPTGLSGWAVMVASARRAIVDASRRGAAVLVLACLVVMAVVVPACQARRDVVSIADGAAEWRLSLLARLPGREVMSVSECATVRRPFSLLACLSGRCVMTVAKGETVVRLVVALILRPRGRLSR